jgi:hypothetical protein
MQALVKQFAEVLGFVLSFDEQKLKNPSIQNDFSYYRRTLSRLKMNEIVSALLIECVMIMHIAFTSFNSVNILIYACMNP